MIEKLYIRADGNAAIATGHIMRCLCIASEVNSLSPVPVSFIVSDRESGEMLKSRMDSFPQEVRISSIVETGVPYTEPSKELHFLRGLFTDEPNGFLLCDTYYVDNSYFSALSDRVRTGFIDDLHAFDPEVDVLIDYSPGEHIPWDSPGSALLGTGYAPVRREFRDAVFTVRDRVSRILVSCGGAENEWTDRILHALSDIPGVVPMPFTDRVSEEFLASDILVSAAGSTLYEAAALGIPTVSVVTADNQISGAMAFDRLHVIPFAGDLRKGDAVFDKLHELVSGLSAEGSFAERSGRSDIMRSLVDGQGARRIAEAILG